MNQEIKLNLPRRTMGVVLGLLPLLLLVTSIVYGSTHSRPKFAAVGWMLAAAIFACINFYYSFFRPLWQFYVLRTSKEKYKHVSGIPLIGSILMIIGGLLSFGAIGSAILGLVVYAFDTGGIIWFIIHTWKDHSLWDSKKA